MDGMFSKRSAGFTLTELAIVMSIVAILMAIGLTAILAPLQVILGDQHIDGRHNEQREQRADRQS